MGQAIRIEIGWNSGAWGPQLLCNCLQSLDVCGRILPMLGLYSQDLSKHCVAKHSNSMQPFQEDEEMAEGGTELADQDVFEIEVPSASIIAVKGLKQIRTKTPSKQ